MFLKFSKSKICITHAGAVKMTASVLLVVFYSGPSSVNITSADVSVFFCAANSMSIFVVDVPALQRSSTNLTCFHISIHVITLIDYFNYISTHYDFIHFKSLV